MDTGFSNIDLKQEAAPKERLYFGIILLLILVSFARWLYLPKLAQTKRIQVEIKNAKLQIDTLKQFAQLKLPAPAASEAAQLYRTGNKFEKAVEASSRSSQQVMADLVRMLTSSEVLNGVIISGMSFGQEVSMGNYGAVPVTIDLEGKYSGVMNYLEHVNKFGRLVMVNNFDLKIKEGSASKVHAKLFAKIYIVHPGGTPTVPAAPGQPMPTGATPTVQTPPPAQK